jgi:hypothetical protein
MEHHQPRFGSSPTFWLLFLSRAQFITLPLADLDTEARSFILDRAKSHGARVA